MFGKVKESEQHLNINWKHFYLSVLALVIPMALQNLINVGVTAADVVMLGKVGEHALSGASLAGQVQYIMTLFLFGLTSGATVLTAQYWGKKDIDVYKRQEKERTYNWIFRSDGRKIFGMYCWL